MSIDGLVVLSGSVEQDKALRALHYISRFVKEGAILSVGAAGGWMDFALALNAGVQVYATDPAHKFKGPAVAAWNDTAATQGLTDRLHRWNVTDEWTEPIGLLWIDGSMSSVAVSEALLAYLPSMLPDGYVALSNTDDENVEAIIKDTKRYFDLTMVEQGDGYQIYAYKGQRESVGATMKAPAKASGATQLAAKPVPVKRPVAKKKKVVRRPASKAK